MGGRNGDRRGNGRRKDQYHDVGDSKPGDVGDSQGTFHDRARQNENVITEEGVQSLDSYERAGSEADESDDTSHMESHSERVSQNQIVGETVTVSIDRYGGTEDTIAEYKNHQIHLRGGEPGQQKLVKLTEGPGYLIGKSIKVSES